jgi:hypothetical protein
MNSNCNACPGQVRRCEWVPLTGIYDVFLLSGWSEPPHSIPARISFEEQTAGCPRMTGPVTAGGEEAASNTHSACGISMSGITRGMIDSAEICGRQCTSWD